MGDHDSVPDYLAELLQPTPSGAEKLLAVWDDLALETRLRLWNILQECHYPTYLRERINAQALSDSNAYVRYLAARELDRASDESGKTELTHSVTAEDSSELVRYAHLEDEYGDIGEGFLSNPVSFFTLPHAARLARIRCLKEDAEEIAEILRHGARTLLPENEISEIELFEIAQEYTQSAYVRRRQRDDEGWQDGYAEYLEGKGNEALWQCVLEVPESVALPLVETLPEDTGLSTGIPREVLDGFPRRLLGRLLGRKDIRLEQFRKKLALDPTNRHASNEMAAVNLALDDDELESMLVDPTDVTEDAAKAEPTQDNIAGRIRLLERFATLGWDLEPVHLLVISDVLRALPMIGLHDPREESALARIGYEKRVRWAAENGYTNEIDRVRLYQAARCASDWDSQDINDLPESLQSLRVEVEPGNPWGTFRRLDSEGAGLPHVRAITKLRREIWLDEIGENPPDPLED